MGVVYDGHMGRRGVVAALLLLGACKAQLSESGADARQTAQPDSKLVLDAGIDGPLMLGAWGTAALVPGASDPNVAEDDCTMSSTKLELYFKRTDAGPNNNLYMMSRATVTGAWGTPVALGVLNSSVAEESPRLSHNDLDLYFGRNGDIFKSSRTAVGQPWGAPTAVTALNTTTEYEKWAAVCDNGYAIVSRTTAANGQDMFEGTITGGATTAITAFNTASADQGAWMTQDCLHVNFQSNRDNNLFDLYEASRTSTSAAWSSPTKLTDFNTTTFNEEDPWVSTDSRVFVFASNAAGSKDVYISTR